MPTPEQIKAAMPAMRGHVATLIDTRPPRVVPPLTDAYVLWRMAAEPGGVAKFIEDQEEARCFK